MNCRYEDPQNVIRKKNIEPVPAYENWIESQTIQDLQAIRYNHNSIHMESLTIRERILTTKCPDVAHPIVFRGAVCADNGRFDRCESLWLHALELRQNNNVSTYTHLHSHTKAHHQQFHNVAFYCTVWHCCTSTIKYVYSLMIYDQRIAAKCTSSNETG